MNKTIVTLVLVLAILFILDAVFLKDSNAEACMNNGEGKKTTLSNGHTAFVPVHSESHHKMVYECTKNN
ncbi:MAG: hypothetical protein HYT94_02555 [Parcubacteria group bacterium]|nr:hypothetical protein [Parcubacteria group bacterium]